MPTRETGIIGYVGEAVVEQWLQRKYPLTEYRVVAQIIPSGIPKSGGGYLDFGVLKNNVVEAVYEVKSQDYISGGDLAINKALLYLWNEAGQQALNFETQNGEKYAGHLDTRAFLILLVGPNEVGLQKIGEKNLHKVILFQDIWDELGNEFSLESVIAYFREDAKIVIRKLKTPDNGKRVMKSFLEIRAKLQL